MHIRENQYFSLMSFMYANALIISLLTLTLLRTWCHELPTPPPLNKEIFYVYFPNGVDFHIQMVDPQACP